MDEWMEERRVDMKPLWKDRGIDWRMGGFLDGWVMDNGCWKNKSIAQQIATEPRGHLHSKYQFLWMSSVDTANTITMSFLSTPTVFVLDPEKHMHYFPESSVTDFTVASFKQFLQDVEDGKIEGSGGTGFLQRLLRLGYDLVSTVVSIWQASRWLFLLMFGLPTIIISVVCYSLCCMEPIDD
ncbi:protein disulfide-isomerase TMX3-like, partial [Haliotis rubra]|uniref:protein disulfide-isomerase TMX3-like n=1 Tax=Haliotis rubra TaxID=36100 RepID=UPI001EE5CD15